MRIKAPKHQSTKLLFNFLILLLLVFNFGCENDTEISQEDAKHSNLNYESRISYINLDDSEILKNYIEEIKISENNIISVTNRTNTEDSYSFTAIETDIIKIIGDSSISYTLKIIKDNQPINSFSNLVIEFIEEQDTNAFIINYYPSDDYLTDVLENKNVPFVGQINKQSIVYDGSLDNMFLRSRCTSVTTIYCTFSSDHVAGPGCVDWPLYNSTTTVCTEVADANPIIDAGDSSGGGGDTPTAPNYVAPCETDSSSSNGQLVDEEGNCYDIELDNYLIECLEIDSPQNTNPDIGHWFYSLATYEQKISLRTFLESNSCNQSAKDFANSAIEAIIDDGEVDFEDQIINELKGKAKCIYDKLQSSSTGFKNMIKQFDGDFPVSHIKLEIDNTLEAGNYGITYPPENFLIKVAYSNTQLANISDLGAAVAFAHETIHAEIFRKMMSAAQQGSLDPNNMTAEEQQAYVESLRTNFPGIYDYYLQRYKPTWDHNMMAEHYINTIADIVEEFDDSSKPREIYESISWAGLRVIENLEESVAWNALSEEEQTNINTNLNTYFFNGNSNCN